MDLVIKTASSLAHIAESAGAEHNSFLLRMELAGLLGWADLYIQLSSDNRRLRAATACRFTSWTVNTSPS